MTLIQSGWLTSNPFRGGARSTGQVKLGRIGDWIIQHLPLNGEGDLGHGGIIGPDGGVILEMFTSLDGLPREVNFDRLARLDLLVRDIGDRAFAHRRPLGQTQRSFPFILEHEVMVLFGPQSHRFELELGLGDHCFGLCPRRCQIKRVRRLVIQFDLGGWHHGDWRCRSRETRDQKRSSAHIQHEGQTRPEQCFHVHVDTLMQTNDWIKNDRKT